MLGIRPSSRSLALLHGEAGSGRRPPPAHESKLRPVNTSGPQSLLFPARARRISVSRDAHPPYIRNNTLLEPLAHACARASLRLSANSAFQAAPRKIITAESCSQMIKPITAARPPYTTPYGTRRT